MDWTPHNLPTVVGVVATPPALASPHPRSDARTLAPTAGLRVELIDIDGADAAVLPLDALFPIRVAAALRVWRALSGHPPGPDPQVLPTARRTRLLLALRALDARQARASYRQIAEGLFGPLPLRGDADWNSHDLRDRTIRLARLGQELMRGGYRRLLLYPYRRLR